MCSNCGIVGSKDREETVVRRFLFRGSMWPSRLRVMVVRRGVSCLAMIA